MARPTAPSLRSRLLGIDGLDDEEGALGQVLDVEEEKRTAMSDFDITILNLVCSIEWSVRYTHATQAKSAAADSVVSEEESSRLAEHASTLYVLHYAMPHSIRSQAPIESQRQKVIQVGGWIAHTVCPGSVQFSSATR